MHLRVVACGATADRVGRRLTLLVAGVIFAVGALLGVRAVFGALFAGRLVVGIAIGFCSVVAPLYISEVAPADMRGAMVSLYQFAITLGIFAAFFVDFGLARAGAWRWMFGLGVVPALILIIGMLPLPESPRYLFKVGRSMRREGIAAHRRP